MPHGCSSFGVRASGGECEAVVVAAEVVALVFLLDVPGPVGVVVAAGRDGAEPEHGLGSWQAPAGAGDAHPVLDQVAAGALDDAGGDRPAVREGGGVVHVGLLVLQVGQGRGDDLGVLAALGRVVCGELPDPAGHLRGPAAQDVQALDDHPVLHHRVAGRVEAPGRLPQVLDDVDEVDHDRDGDAAGGGLGPDPVQLAGVAVGQRDPGPAVIRVAAFGLVEDLADGDVTARG